ncbi:hypothetical protein HJ588_08950 [Flexivirga sp. ID2601S]|uniref:Integral membrane protein n=1 Tax=Flexivirga aerilata TaxID=1656889 RepID=A0A849AHK4_9MICO|nr:hypothetical protein [Flexivirga aerilata]NNG39403.1 hypothetical protein [Flexivirga aerilata]
MVAVDAAPEARPSRTTGVLLGVVRVLAVIQVVAVMGQASFAGLFLSGRYDMLGLHQHGADLVWYGGLLQLLLTLGFGWSSHSWAAAGFTALIVIAETAQYFAGVAGALYLHIPLGVSIAVGVVLFAVWIFRWKRPSRSSEQP